MKMKCVKIGCNNPRQEDDCFCKEHRNEQVASAEAQPRHRSQWIDPHERTIDRGFNDIVGLVNPQHVMDDPGYAIQALLTIRRLADFIERITQHTDCDGVELTPEDFRVLGYLSGCIHQVTGYVVEYLERDVQPRFREEYAEAHGEKRVATLNNSKG